MYISSCGNLLGMLFADFSSDLFYFWKRSEFIGEGLDFQLHCIFLNLHYVHIFLF